MSLISFVKEAGEKLFGRGQAQAAMAEVKSDPANEAKIAAANAAAGDAILDYIKAQNLSATGLTVTFDGATSTVSVFGVAPDQATKEKIALCCGNVAGVVAVNNMMSVDQSAPEATYYTVVVRRQPVEDLEGELRRSEQVHGDLRGEQADAHAPGQDLSGPGAADSAAVIARWTRPCARATPSASRPAGSRAVPGTTTTMTTSRRVLQHMQNLDGAIVGIRRVLASDGQFLFSYHNKRNAHRILTYPKARRIADPFSHESAEVSPTLISHHPERMDAILGDAGFTQPDYRGAVVVNSLATLAEKLGSGPDPAGLKWATFTGEHRLAPWLIGRTRAVDGPDLAAADSIDELFECPSCRGDVRRLDESYECASVWFELPDH